MVRVARVDDLPLSGLRIHPYKWQWHSELFLPVGLIWQRKIEFAAKRLLKFRGGNAEGVAVSHRLLRPFNVLCHYVVCPTVLVNAHMSDQRIEAVFDVVPLWPKRLSVENGDFRLDGVGVERRLRHVDIPVVGERDLVPSWNHVDFVRLEPPGAHLIDKSERLVLVNSKDTGVSQAELLPGPERQYDQAAVGKDEAVPTENIAFRRQQVGLRLVLPVDHHRFLEMLAEAQNTSVAHSHRRVPVRHLERRLADRTVRKIKAGQHADPMGTRARPAWKVASTGAEAMDKAYRARRRCCGSAITRCRQVGS